MYTRKVYQRWLMYACVIDPCLVPLNDTIMCSIRQSKHVHNDTGGEWDIAPISTWLEHVIRICSSRIKDIMLHVGGPREIPSSCNPTKDEPRNALACVGSCTSIRAGLRRRILNVGSLVCTRVPTQKGYYANDSRKTRRGNLVIGRSRAEHGRERETAGRL